MKKNASLILGAMIPLLMTALVVASIYLPQLSTKPRYDFVYVLGGDYYNRQPYKVENGKLVKQTLESLGNNYFNPPYTEPTLHVYDVARKASRDLTFLDAQGLSLDSSLTSPDGFVLTYGQDRPTLPFFFQSGDDYNARYLKGHNMSIKLNLQTSANSYDNNFSFVGWVKK